MACRVSDRNECDDNTKAKKKKPPKVKTGAKFVRCQSQKPAARFRMYSCRSCHPVPKMSFRARCGKWDRHIPPPTRTITFFVAVLASPLDPARLRVVNLHVTVFLANEFENAYCARTSSPSRGIALSGGSTRSISNPCAIELTIAATSASSGSRGLPGLYRYGEIAAEPPPPPKSLSRDDGRDGVRSSAGVDDDSVSRKLDGGSFAAPPPIDGLIARGLLPLLFPALMPP